MLRWLKAAFQYGPRRYERSVLRRHGDLLLFQQHESHFVDFPHVCRFEYALLHEAAQEARHGRGQDEITRSRRLCFGRWHQRDIRHCVRGCDGSGTS